VFAHWIDGAFRAEAMAQLGGSLDGMLTEYAVLDERALVRIPAHLSYEEAACLPCAGVTAWSAVVKLGNIKPGQVVLTQGTGGVSLFALQLARLAGARVLAADRGDEKLAGAREAGAHETIDALAGPIAPEARRLTDGRGVDVAIDFVVDDDTLQAGVDALAPNGRLLILGGRRGAKLPLDAHTLLNRELAILGSRYVTRQDIVDALELVRRGAVRPIVTRTYPLEEAERVHQEVLGQSAAIGRVALIV
jgi:NADPH:quinone reductase-like Zn-dependent oxidoreductase